MSDVGVAAIQILPDRPRLLRQRKRLHKILRRHVRIDDEERSDRDMVKAVLKRFEHENGWELVDPAE